MFFKISQLCIYGTLYDIWVLKISWSIEVPGYLGLDPFLFLEWQSDKEILGRMDILKILKELCFLANSW